MALTLSSFPSQPLPSDHLMSFNDISECMTSLSDVFNPYLVKTEPASPEESMDTSSTSCGATYTDLSSPNFSQILASQTDLYRDNSSCNFSSWTYRHPEHWGRQEVLDWVFFIAEVENFDGARFCGEAYQGLSGQQLCSMSQRDFVALDRHYGARLHSVFQSLSSGASFNEPSPPEVFRGQTVGNVPHFLLINEGDSDTPIDPPDNNPPTPTTDNTLGIIVDQNEVKVDLGELGIYPIDVTLGGNNQVLDEISDSGYHSASEGSQGHRSPAPVEAPCPDSTFSYSDDEDLDVTCADYPHKAPSSSVSSDSGCETDDKPKNGSKRRPSSTAKGNHLWEFVRDLLKDSRFNPSLLKWEDKDQGVFKFVQSEAVAQMWGRKKNNPGMTYEKLSRAMRFCRSAGYFESVPKTGRFPKKLCFKFGQKAHDWRD